MQVFDYNFRSKKNLSWSLAGICEGIEEKSGAIINKKIFYYNEYYYYYFLSGEIYREACYKCKYACTNRQGDFTLGDFWGVEKIHLPFSVSKGCSLVLTNNEKADEILKELDILTFPVDIEEAKKNNRQLVCPSLKPEDRRSIINLFISKKGNEIQNYYLKKNRLKRYKSYIKYHFPQSIKKKLIKIRSLCH